MKYASLILLMVSGLALADESGPYRCYARSSVDESLRPEARASTLNGIESAVLQMFGAFKVDEKDLCKIDKIIDQQTGRKRVLPTTIGQLEYQVSNQQIQPMYLGAFWITKPVKRKKFDPETNEEITYVRKIVTFTPIFPLFSGAERKFEVWSEKVELPYAACYYRCEEDKSAVAKEGK